MPFFPRSLALCPILLLNQDLAWGWGMAWCHCLPSSLQSTDFPFSLFPAEFSLPIEYSFRVVSSDFSEAFVLWGGGRALSISVSLHSSVLFLLIKLVDKADVSTPHPSSFAGSFLNSPIPLSNGLSAPWDLIWIMVLNSRLSVGGGNSFLI